MNPKHQTFAQPDRSHKTILVTGISMTKGLTIARLLRLNTPHTILGADIEPIPFTSPGRYSASIRKFFRLQTPDGDDTEPYIDSLLSVIKREKVDLWISCSSVVSAVEDGEVAKLAQIALGSKFQAIQFSPEVVEKLHSKDRFVEYIKSLGLMVPESYRVTSSDEAMGALHRGKGKKYIMKPVGVDDRARANMMTLLPFKSPSETNSYIQRLRVSKENPFQLQQYIDGPEYCTHALVIRGTVKAFVACPSSDLLMHYSALDPKSTLTQKMLRFTEKVASDGGSSFTGHLSFDFLVEGEGEDVKLYPIECNPRAHTAVVLFEKTPEMADAYLDVFTDGRKKREGAIFPERPIDSYCWMGHELVTLLIIPLLTLLLGQGTLQGAKSDVAKFWNHLVCWRDGTFELWDPLPFLVLYHVYWPAQFLNSLIKGKTWSR